MKKIATLCCSVLLAGSALAQIPNANFESWTAHTGYDTPDSWDNLNSMTSLASVYTCEKGTTGAPSGASYLKLTSKTVTGIGVAPGIAVTGTINTTTFSVTGGFPFTTRPINLTGQWQYMAYGSDAGHIAIMLSKWNMTTSRRDTVAFTDQVLSGMAMSWASFTIPVIYRTGAIPDTAMILLSSSGSTPVANSYLWVDTLKFTGASPAYSVNSTNKETPLTIYPNPATNATNVVYYSSTGADISISVTDMSGRIVRELNSKATKGENNVVVNTSGISSGIYTVRVTEEQAHEERMLMIK